MPNLRRGRHPKGSDAFLWVRGGPADGRTIGLSTGMNIIERASASDIVIEEAGVSRQHASIRVGDRGFWIEDLGSKNGTRVNGTEVRGEGQRLRDMDQIQLGTIETPCWIFRESEGTVQIHMPRISPG